MEPGGSMPLSNNSYPEPSQLNSSYTYFFKIHSNIVLPSTPTPTFFLKIIIYMLRIIKLTPWLKKPEGLKTFVKGIIVETGLQNYWHYKQYF